MRTFVGSIAFLLLGALPGTLLRADDVYLKNGRSFEGVVAEVTDAQVRIILPGGSISLARSAVDRVEKSETNLSDYLGRKEEIMAREKHASRNAADWLELARWARANDLPQGAREAALRAAEINPREPGLSGLLRGFGYVYEESLDRWISYDDAMRLHGFVQEGGTWVSREEHAERAQAAAQVRAQAALAAREEAAAARDLLAAEMMQAQVAAAQQGAYANGYGGGQFLGGFYGGLGSAYWPFGIPGFGTRRGFGERGERGERHGEHGAFRAPRAGSPPFGSMVFGVPGSPLAPRSSVFGQ
jgi:hypothetical protein